MYYVSNVHSSKTESHKLFQLVASSMRPHAKLESVTKKRCMYMYYVSNVQSSKS